MLDCGERLRRYYQKNIVTGNIHDFLDEEEPVIVTVTTVIFQLLNSNVTADTWPAKWNATTQELVYEWLHVMNFIRSILSIKMLPHRSTNIGHYELELVWDVTDPHVRRNIKYANLKNSMDSYFRGRPVGQRLGNMMPRNDPGDSVRDLEVSITNMFSSWRDIHMKQRNCFCSAFEESETLMVAVSTDEVISLNATNKRTIEETRNQIERDLDPLSRKGLKIKTVDASGMYRKESGKRANLLVLYFDQSDEISDGESINYMLTSVKRGIPLKRHGIQLKHPERLQWKVCLFFFSSLALQKQRQQQLVGFGANHNYTLVNLRLNIIYKGTAQKFHDTVNQLKSKLIANFRESVIFNELTYFCRFREKTQMTLHFFIEANRVLSDATESNGRFRAVWE
ncbi:hypothetical protein D915_010556 [Fasciola hepatica]|uniref:Uncharacterized protein n=1 Tax=Fasciola hepatica TaxID=6192 RepID=A0A4E0R7K4_FASHE|nr:hypothetical protein D915_010556 [Fasciola hepatica]